MKNKKISPLTQIVLLVTGLIIIAATFYWVSTASSNQADVVKTIPSTPAAQSIVASPEPSINAKPDFSFNIPTTPRTVSIAQWKVQFTAPLASSDIAYSIRDSGFAVFWSPSLRASSGGQSCGPESLALGGLARVSSLDAAGDPKPAVTKKIGDYYYYYMHPQHACSTTQTAQDILQANLKGLQSSLPQSLESY